MSTTTSMPAISLDDAKAFASATRLQQVQTGNDTRPDAVMESLPRWIQAIIRGIDAFCARRLW